jgi:hypothetical protein
MQGQSRRRNATGADGLWRGVETLSDRLLQPQQMTPLPAAAERGQVQANAVLFDPARSVPGPGINAPTEAMSINIHLWQVNPFCATVP